ncbi:hypothetical protein OC834_003315 [Tilletia horrida]|nr:hypothetical protein OC834_003315 [Tilletia horrida]
MKLIVTSAILAAVAIFADGVEARGKGRAPRAVPQLEGCEMSCAQEHGYNTPSYWQCHATEC